MYSVINQCCPYCCLTTCSSTVVTPTQVVPLVLFTLSPAWAIHRANRSFSLSPMLRVDRQSAVYISSTTTFLFLFKVFSLRFNFEICNKKAESCWTLTWSGQCSIFVRFCPSEHLFLLLNPRVGFPVPCFFLEFPCSCLGCPFLVLSQKKSHSDNIQTVMAAATS
jgi:hypothetical protein